MRGRICGYTAKAGVKMAVAVVMGMTLASCGAIEIDNQARRDGEPSESSSESEVGTPTKGNDGRMLQPEGHEGLWFETEPADPWERYVWLSQKYVGDPVVLGQLEEGDAAAPFVGEPDICSDSVVERMGELGFESQVGLNTESSYTCSFTSSGSSDVMLIDVLLRNDISDSDFENVDVDFGPGSSNILRYAPTYPEEFQCLAEFKPGEENRSLFIAAESGTASEDRDGYCRRAYLAFYILNNLGITWGK